LLKEVLRKQIRYPLSAYSREESTPGGLKRHF